MNPSTAQAAVLIDEIIVGGVTDAVLAPGSRSAPLALALHAAEQAGRIRLHVRTDERTAAFVALGLARGSGRPVPVVTTSGTAVANLHPAVLEAHHDGVPLLVLSADRPPRLRDVGANQAIRHMTVFAPDTLRYQAELGVAQRVPGQNGYWRGQVCRALAATRGAFHSGRPGPAHLNLPFDVPLVPDGDIDAYDVVLGARPAANGASDNGASDNGASGNGASDSGPAVAVWPESLAGRGGPWTTVNGCSPAGPAVARGVSGEVGCYQLIRPPQSGEKCLFIASFTDSSAALVAAAGYPVVAEAAGLAGQAVLAAGEHLVADAAFVRAYRPDRVIVLGRPTLFRSVSRLLSTAGVTIDVVDAPSAYADTAGSVRDVAAALGDVMPAESTLPPAWLAAWRAADAAVRHAISTGLGTAATSSAVVIRAMAAALPDPAGLVMGSSLAPRDLGRYAAPRDGVRVFANRGVAGIDGTVSTAIGVALARAAAAAGPTYALMGDLTFLHDVTGLAIGPKDARPDITIVVLNNDGGGIFATLEQGATAYAGAFERVFATPVGVRLGSIVEGFGATYELVTSVDRLVAAMVETVSGIRVLEVPVDRGGLRQLDARMSTVVHDALRAHELLP